MLYDNVITSYRFFDSSNSFLIRSFLLSLLTVYSVAHYSGAHAAAMPTPTAEQMRIFQQLSPQDQQAAIAAFKGNSNATQTAARKSLEPAIIEPGVASPIPRQTDSNSKLEVEFKQSTEHASLEEKKQEKVIKQKLKQFGYDLFAGTPTTFAPAANIPIPTGYIIGPGDSIQVQLFGKENAAYELTVTREGKLQFPGIGPISVVGLRFDKLVSRLQSRIKRQMIGVKANITMGTLRSIRVFVLGDVIRPGSYTVSALSSMTNALFVSGGIEPIGSLRNIQLKRAGKIITTLDLYDLLLRGDTSKDKRLQPGDVIFIPPIGRTVGVAGAVKRPAIYELNQEQTVKQALAFAGGLLATAYPKATQLERITESGDRTLLDIDASEDASLNLAIKDGDVIRVYANLDKMDNVVLLSGHVQRPGGAQWHKGMRLTDLVKSIDELLANPDLDYVVVKRETSPSRRIIVLTTNFRRALQDPSSEANLELQARDEVFFFGVNQSSRELLAPVIDLLVQQERHNRPAEIIAVHGNVHFSGTYPYSKGMRVSDALRAALDVLPQTDMNYAVIARRSVSSSPAGGREGRLSAFSFSLAKANQDPSGFSNVLLQPRDEILIFNTREFRPSDIDPTTPFIQQKFERGVVAAVPNLKTLENDKALAKKSVLNRQVLLAPLIKQLYAQSQFGEKAAVVSISGLVTAPGQYPMDQNMKLMDLVHAAGNMTEAAYALSAEITRYNIVGNDYREVNHYTITQSQLFANNISESFELQPYDHLLIKRIPQWLAQRSIELIGEIKFPGVYLFRRGETLSEVIERAGGLTKYAFPGGALFTRKGLQIREQIQLDKLADRLESDLAASAQEKRQALNASVDAQPEELASSLLRQLRETKAVGRLVIELDKIVALNKPQEDDDEDPDAFDSRYPEKNIILKNGDKLYVPQQTQEVTILGEVHQQTSHRFNKDMSRADYVSLSGGTTYKADKGRIYIVRANGAVLSDENSSWFGGEGIAAGDTIVVPLDAERMKPLTFWTNVTQIIYQLGIAAAAWNSLGVF
ncbi:MAG: SLBB domain-containing protein [Thiohalomonadales bacterium]